MEQLVAFWSNNPKVAGSSPSYAPTIFYFMFNNYLYSNRQSVKISGLWVFGATGSMAVSKTADRGSNPLSPVLYLIYKCFGRVAQERAADINQRVDGASPSSSTCLTACEGGVSIHFVIV